MNLAKFSLTQIKVGLQYIIVWETSNKTLLLLFSQFETDFKEILGDENKHVLCFRSERKLRRLRNLKQEQEMQTKKGTTCTISSKDSPMIIFFF